MGSPHTIKMTKEILNSYSQAALDNADELLVEASLLLDHDHMARAYFLAVACIEEAGKALLCFDAQKRNHSNPAARKRIKVLTENHRENHREKVNYAMLLLAFGDPDPSEALKVVPDLMYALNQGRELSMYSDLSPNPDRVQIPKEVVRPKAARDCVRLAESCLANAHRHVIERVPFNFTSAQDRLFTMKSTKSQEIMTSADFWWYYTSRMEVGQQDFAEMFLDYERDHIKTGTFFHVVK